VNNRFFWNRRTGCEEGKDGRHRHARHLHRRWAWWFGRPGEEGRWFGPRRHRGFGRFFGPGGGFDEGGGGFDEGGHGRRRHRRGDIKFVLLELLVEQPRHGYDLIKALEERSGGFYRPSPGSIYPTLQLLEEEGLVTSATDEGKRIYTVTEAGRQLLATQGRHHPAAGMGPHHGESPMGGTSGELDTLRRSTDALLASVTQVARHGTTEQVQAATALLDTARRDIYRILAEGNES
jgi:DNA-binding PadR family transcriptional regulator